MVKRMWEGSPDRRPEKKSKTEHVFKLIFKKLKIIHMPNIITVDWVAILIYISDILGSNSARSPNMLIELYLLAFRSPCKQISE